MFSVLLAWTLAFPAAFAGDPRILAAEARGDTLPLARAVGAGEIAADERVSGLLDAAEAERQLLAGEPGAAVRAAARVPTTSRAYLRARRLTVEAQRERAKLRSAAAAAVDGAHIATDPADRAGFLYAIASLYDSIGEYSAATRSLELGMVAGHARPPQAAAEWTAVGWLGGMSPFVVIALGSILEGPLHGQWYEPRLAVARADAYTHLCRYAEAEAALEAGAHEQALLGATLRTAASESDQALVARWSAGAWANPGLSSWLASDPDLALAAERVAGAAPEDAPAYTALEAGWLRRRIADAQARLARAEALLPPASARVAADRIAHPSRAGLKTDAHPPFRKRFVVRVSDPFVGRLRPATNLMFYRYSGSDLCYDRSSPPPNIDG